jgi:hypothetical protein
MDAKTEARKKMTTLNKFYNFKKVSQFFKVLRDSGIINMWQAPSFLYIGRERLEHEFKYKHIPDKENFEELLDMADNMERLMKVGVQMKISKANENTGDEETDDYDEFDRKYMANFNRTLQKDSEDLFRVWAVLLGKDIKESYSLKEHISKILKEETSLKKKLKDLIDKEGLIRTARKVNGIFNLAKVLDTSVLELLKQFALGKEISTYELNDTGGYDFVGKIIDIQDNDYSDVGVRRFDFIFEVQEGTVELIMTNDDRTHNLLDPEFQEADYFWEVTYEIQDILNDNYRELFRQLRLDSDLGFVKFRVIFKK